MKKNELMAKRRLKIKSETKIFINNSISISDRIYNILESKEMGQKDLALLLNKKESEISKWLRGTHNFTLKTLSKIEAVLNAPIISIVDKEKEIDVELQNYSEIAWQFRDYKDNSLLGINLEWSDFNPTLLPEDYMSGKEYLC